MKGARLVLFTIMLCLVVWVATQIIGIGVAYALTKMNEISQP